MLIISVIDVNHEISSIIASINRIKKFVPITKLLFSNIISRSHTYPLERMV